VHHRSSFSRTLRHWTLLPAIALASVGGPLPCNPAQAQTGPLADFFRFRETTGREPFGAEDPYAEDITPRIPEPLVFDLVRPLGARQGELEVNVLAEFPFNRRRVPSQDDPNVLETVGITEWAPEIEYAIFDGFAVEFELPFEESRLAAYKAAAQWTIGTAFEEQYIHGTQVIVEHFRDFSITEMTFLYLVGIRFSEEWSTMCMFGFRTVSGIDEPAERLEPVVNLSLFRDLTDRLTGGIETNYSTTLDGTSHLLVMPQYHWEVTDHAMLQFGCGVDFAPNYTMPLAALRAIYTF